MALDRGNGLPQPVTPSPAGPLPPVFARWWFWAGVGAVVATGAVVTAALLTERSADKGSIAPDQALAPFRF